MNFNLKFRRVSVIFFLFLLLISTNSLYSSSSIGISSLSVNNAPISVEPSSKDFGNITIYSYSEQTFTVTNISGEPITLDSLYLSGTGQSQFIIVGEWCSYRTLFPNDSCYVIVDFYPKIEGVHNAYLNISSSINGFTFYLPLSGTGIPPKRLYLTIEGEGRVFDYYYYSYCGTYCEEGLGGESLTLMRSAKEEDNYCELAYPENTELLLNAIECENSVFVGWIGDCEEIEGGEIRAAEEEPSPTCFLTMDSDKYVTAVFSPAYFITSYATSGGTIDPLGTTKVIKGGEVTYTIEADEGYYIKDIKVDGYSLRQFPYSSPYEYTFTNVTSNHTIRAIFGTELQAIISQPTQDYTFSTWSVYFDGSRSDHINPITYSWNFNNTGSTCAYTDQTGRGGGTSSLEAGYVKFYNTGYTPCEVEINLTITDTITSNTSSASKNIIIYPLGNPKAIITEPLDGSVIWKYYWGGVDVRFDGSQSFDSDNCIISNRVATIECRGRGISKYEWDFNYNGRIFDTDAQGPIVNYTFYNTGTYTIALRVTDDEIPQLGNQKTDITTITINIQPTWWWGSLPTVKITKPFDNQTFGLFNEINFVGLIETDYYYYSNFSYTWDFGDGTIIEGEEYVDKSPYYGFTTSHFYDMEGVYKVTFTVSDGSERSYSSQITLEIHPLFPPRAELEAPCFTNVGQAVVFDASKSTDRDGYVLWYSYNFGDGNISKKDRVTEVYAYLSSGTYWATLKVTDNDGASSYVTTPINVEYGDLYKFEPGLYITSSGYPEYIIGNITKADNGWDQGNISYIGFDPYDYPYTILWNLPSEELYIASDNEDKHLAITSKNGDLALVNSYYDLYKILEANNPMSPQVESLFRGTYGPQSVFYIGGIARYEGVRYPIGTIFKLNMGLNCYSYEDAVFAITGPNSYPVAMTFDIENNLYVAVDDQNPYGYDKIVKYNIYTGSSEEINIYYGESSLINNPKDIAINRMRDQLFVATDDGLLIINLLTYDYELISFSFTEESGPTGGSGYKGTGPIGGVTGPTGGGGEQSYGPTGIAMDKMSTFLYILAGDMIYKYSIPNKVFHSPDGYVSEEPIPFYYYSIPGAMDIALIDDFSQTIPVAVIIMEGQPSSNDTDTESNDTTTESLQLASNTTGYKVQFDGSKSYDPSGKKIVLYKWDFGDGTKLETSKPKVEHTYSSVSEYVVQLIVNNGEVDSMPDVYVCKIGTPCGIINGGNFNIILIISAPIILISFIFFKRNTLFKR